ncbi:MAG: DNA alkylation repair protein [Spirochaetaceae bacterium]|nr:MAG: DNA alkylation repair protein [Spirochaetaceae bacterium]
MGTGALIRHIKNDLLDGVDSAYFATIENHFRMDTSNFLGVPVPVVRSIADRHYQSVRSLPPRERLGLCEELLATGEYELRLVAFRWAHKTLPELAATDVASPVAWIEEHVTDWSDCDDLGMQVIGLLFLRFPGQAMQVLDWCGSGNRWLRRSAAVTLIRAARQGHQLDLVFQVSRALASEKDDLVRKAHGWLLRETSRKRPDEVFQYLMDNRDHLLRSLITMASRKLSPEQRKALQTA